MSTNQSSIHKHRVILLTSVCAVTKKKKKSGFFYYLWHFIFTYFLITSSCCRFFGVFFFVSPLVIIPPLDFCNIFFQPNILGFHAIIRGSCIQPADVEKLPSGDCQTQESFLWCTTLQFRFTNINNSLPKPPKYPASLQFKKPSHSPPAPSQLRQAPVPVTTRGELR